MPTNSRSLTPIPRGFAALVFTDGQLIFQHLEDGVEYAKIVSGAAVNTAFQEAGIDSGWLEPGVVRWGVSHKGSWSVQFIHPERERTLLFERTTDGDLIPDHLTLRLPPLVMIGINATYHLWALREREVHARTPLYYAPFPNVYGNSHICFGSNTVAPVEQDGMRQALKLFCEAPFGQTSIQNKSVRHPQDVRQMLKEVADSGGAYPVEDLVPYHTETYLGDMLARLLA